MTTKDALNNVKQKIEAKTAEQRAQMVGVYRFYLTGEDGIDCILTIDSTGVQTTYDGTGEPGVTVTMSAGNFKALMEGRLDPTVAFMSGQLIVTGSMGQAMKLSGVLG